MLNIFHSREDLDKEKFIFDHLDLNENNILIVPDQFTLSMEEDLFSYLNISSLLRTEVTSFSKMGNDLLHELGGDRKKYIDKYGRHIILSKVIKECEEELVKFRGISSKSSFINLANNFISELKQGNVDVKDLEDILSSFDEESDSYKKFKELKLIYEKYEEAIKGKYLDSEDRIDEYVNKIQKSEKIKSSNIYLYGFESLAPKALNILGELIVYAKSVNVVITYDEEDPLFNLTGLVIKNLKKRAENRGVEVDTKKIPEDYYIENRKSGIKEIEKNLYTFKSTKENVEGVTLVQSNSIYNEAETVASYILHLIRDLGYKESDISIITNDQDVREPILKRMCKEYGLDVFSSLYVAIWDTPIVQFIIALMETVSKNYDTKALLKLIKSGFTDLTDEEVMKLESYVKKYKIKYTMWKKPFSKGSLEYGDDLLLIEELRKKVINPIILFEDICRCEKVDEYISSLYKFLDEEIKMPEKIEGILKEQEEYSKFDLALKTSQVFNSMIDVFEQLRELLKDSKFEIDEFTRLLSIGLKEVKVSLLPLSKDSILLGNMEKLRLKMNTRCLIVMGMNEGLIPLNIKDDALITEEEKELLKEKGLAIFKTDEVMEMEERLAIYRNLSKPLDSLFITYSKADSDGKTIKESELFSRLKDMSFALRNDIVSSNGITNMLNGNVSGMRHLTHEISKGKELNEKWKKLLKWYHINEPEKIKRLKDAFSFDNVVNPLGYEKAKLLYSNDDSISLGPTSIEKYIKCPFSFFLNKGLKLNEERVFESSGIDFGDFAHDIIMNFTKEMSKDNKAPFDDGSKWKNVTEEEIVNIVDTLVDKKIDTFKEEIFKYSEEEIYKAKRLKKSLESSCINLTAQINKGQIKEIFFEEEFKRGKKFEPITFDTQNGKVYIEGRIDRVDILKDDKVKIIDYKTGKDTFDIEKAKIGYQIQLILYLRAAEEGKRKPAGVFYFHVMDKKADIKNKRKSEITREYIKNEIEKGFKLNGIMLNDDSVIESIHMGLEGESTVAQVGRNKGKELSKSSRVLEEEEFKSLEETVVNKVYKGLTDLSSGKISISPIRIKRGSQINTSCDHCMYLGICRFERNAPGANYKEE